MQVQCDAIIFKLMWPKKQNFETTKIMKKKIKERKMVEIYYFIDHIRTLQRNKVDIFERLFKLLFTWTC